MLPRKVLRKGFSGGHALPQVWGKAKSRAGLNTYRTSSNHISVRAWTKKIHPSNKPTLNPETGMFPCLDIGAISRLKSEFSELGSD